MRESDRKSHEPSSALRTSGGQQARGGGDKNPKLFKRKPCGLGAFLAAPCGRLLGEADGCHDDVHLFKKPRWTCRTRTTSRESKSHNAMQEDRPIASALSFCTLLSLFFSITGNLNVFFCNRCRLLHLGMALDAILCLFRKPDRKRMMKRHPNP